MLRAHPNVIDALLRQWEGPDGLKRWYYNKWDRYLSSTQIMEYRERYGVNPVDRDLGIQMFFDDEGYLHIKNCQDNELEAYLESKMAGWYQWAKDAYRAKFGFPSMNVIELIEPYTKTLKPGFYQTRYNGKIFNFDEGIRFWFSQKYLPFNRDRCCYTVSTGYPRLDEILKEIINSDASSFPAVISTW